MSDSSPNIRATSGNGGDQTPDAEASAASPRNRSIGRLPAATLGLGFAAGILIDRYSTLPASVLFQGFAAAGVVWLLLQCSRQLRIAASVALVISGLAGAIHHHHVWHSIPASDITPLLSSEPVLVRCKGVVATPPVTSLPRENSFSSDLPPQQSTHFQLDVTSLDTKHGLRNVSGRLQIIVDGRLPGVHAGDRIDVQGWSQANRPLMNPGGFDASTAGRRTGVRGIVRVRQAELIGVLQAGPSVFEKIRRTLRRRAEMVLESALPEDLQPIADAMLLGDRSMLQRDVRTMFVESGTVHLLAISGLHIGILMMFLLVPGRALGLSSRVSIPLAVAVLFIYLQVADCRPPMVRAFVIILVWSAGRLSRRPALSANSLAVAAIVILGINPTSLFDVGSQLSFLAVAVIFWLASLGRFSFGSPDVAATADSNSRSPGGTSTPDALQRPWVRSVKSVASKLTAAWLMSGSIWLVSAPLVISVFNVVSPAGLIINVLLIPLVGIGMFFGFAAILIGVVSQWLAWPFAVVFGWFLKFLVSIVELAASMKMGHLYVPEPPTWWLIAFYSMVAVAMLVTTQQRRPARMWGCVGFWTVFGLTLLPAQREEGSLRCTILSVGHGLSVIVETPGDRTLVYDVGSRSGGRFSSRILKEALWARGISRVDALIVSHSDVDHYNGVVDLLNSMRVARVFCSRHFPDTEQPLTLQMFERAARAGITPDFISRGDRITLDEKLEIEVLQPVAATSYRSDNASSVVVELTYRGRRILLTGDLDEDGLRELLNQSPRDVDVLLAPHHGEPGANPPSLADWAKPEWVIASAPTPQNRKRLESNYGSGTQVIMTPDAGAVSVEITGSNRLTVKAFAGDNHQQ